MALRYHPGKMVEAYWPDDDEWLAATVTHVKESGTIGITWSSDGSISSVPPDYVRVVQSKRIDDVLNKEVTEDVCTGPPYRRLSKQQFQQDITKMEVEFQPAYVVSPWLAASAASAAKAASASVPKAKANPFMLGHPGSESTGLYRRDVPCKTGYPGSLI